MKIKKKIYKYSNQTKYGLIVIIIIKINFTTFFFL